jgi:hydrogenase-1 operon protein HyaF
MPVLPEREDVADLDAGLRVLHRIAAALERARERLPTVGIDAVSERIDLDALDEPNRRLVNQVLGEGEVSARIDGERSLRIQESVFAGVWRIAGFDSELQVEDYVEITSVPFELRVGVCLDAAESLSLDPSAARLPAMALNAPSILTELAEKVAQWHPGCEPHVVNLTLLPLSPEDLACLDERLGSGRVTILSRGYGNCRVSSTRVRNCWRIAYYNSQDAVILSTIEVSAVPDAVCAAAEDLRDSAERFAEVIQWVSSGTS